MSNVAVVRTDLTERAIARLVAHTPAVNTGNVEKRLGEILGAPLVIGEQMMFPDDGPAYSVIMSIDRPRGVTQAQIDDCRRALDLAILPAPDAAIVGWLAELYQIVATRQMAEIDIKAKGAAYLPRLAMWPADAVRTVLLVETWRFFPAWEELEARLTRLTRRRDALRNAIKGWQPWSRDDEIRHLRGKASAARNAISYYRTRDPAKAARAKTALYRHELALHELGEGSHPDDMDAVVAEALKDREAAG